MIYPDPTDVACPYCRAPVHGPCIEADHIVDTHQLRIHRLMVIATYGTCPQCGAKRNQLCVDGNGEPGKERHVGR